MRQNANWAWSGGINRDYDADPLDLVSIAGRSSYPIPRTRPPKPVPIDLEALAAFNAGVERARAEYARRAVVE